MVDQFQTELLPVAAQLTARLVRSYIYMRPFILNRTNMWCVCSANRICALQEKLLIKKMR